MSVCRLYPFHKITLRPCTLCRYLNGFDSSTYRNTETRKPRSAWVETPGLEAMRLLWCWVRKICISRSENEVETESRCIDKLHNDTYKKNISPIFDGEKIIYSGHSDLGEKRRGDDGCWQICSVNFETPLLNTSDPSQPPQSYSLRKYTLTAWRIHLLLIDIAHFKWFRCRRYHRFTILDICHKCNFVWKNIPTSEMSPISERLDASPLWSPTTDIGTVLASCWPWIQT